VPENLPEVSPAVEELAHQRLATGDVRVHLDPGGPVHFPASLIGAPAYLVQHLRMILGDELIELRLAANEAIVGVAFHETQCRGERARSLFAGLRQGPQPGYVDMGVPDGAHPLRAGGCGAGGHSLSERLPCGLDRGVEGVAQRLAVVDDGDGLL